MQLLVDGADEVVDIDGHPVERRELGEAVGQLLLQAIRRLELHRVDDYIPQMLMTLPDVDSALGVLLLLRQLLPRLVAHLLAARLPCSLGDE